MTGARILNETMAEILNTTVVENAAADVEMSLAE